MILLECQDIIKRYRNKTILKGGEIKVSQGELVGLIGENGCGKSTLLKCILDYIPCQNGKITIENDWGYCPQEDILFQQYTLLEHLNLMVSIFKKKHREVYDYTQELLMLFKLLPHKNTLIGQLSSGTCQKLKFITAVMHQPKLIILDEPYDGFDWSMVEIFWKVIGDLKARGCGILLVTHFIYDFKNFDHIYEIQEGIISQYEKKQFP